MSQAIKRKSRVFQTRLFAGLVDPEGFEPSAFSMPLRRAPNCAMGPANANSTRKAARRQRLSPGRLPTHERPQSPLHESSREKRSRLLGVDLEGFEPSASSVRLKRAPNCATGPSVRPVFYRGLFTYVKQNRTTPRPPFPPTRPRNASRRDQPRCHPGPAPAYRQTPSRLRAGRTEPRPGPEPGSSRARCTNIAARGREAADTAG
jgi:hypothetical protein